MRRNRSVVASLAALISMVGGSAYTASFVVLDAHRYGGTGIDIPYAVSVLIK